MIDDDDLDYEEELATETEHRPKIKKAVASRAAANYLVSILARRATQASPERP